jgi:hypothetical protein
MPVIDVSQLVVRSPGAIVEPIGDQLVVLDLDHDRYLNIDGVGQELWNMAAEPITVAAMVDRLLADYDVERTVLERDVTAFVDKAIALGVLTCVAAP